MTEATQSLLPVTQADRDEAAKFLRGVYGEHAFDSLWAPTIERGAADWHVIVRLVAAVRQAHSLPGDVGMLERDRWTLEELLDDIEDEWIDHYLRPDSAERAKCKRCGGDDFDKSSIDHKDGCLVGRIRDARAALTPSPCPGDVGMLQDALVQHNERLRSAVAIADRDGADTNWLAFRGQARFTLAEYQDIVKAARAAVSTRNGYAPGNYTILCIDCKKQCDGCDKRAIRCEDCAAALTPSATISEPTKRMEQTLGARFQANSSALSGDAGEGEPFPGCYADLQRRRVVTLAKLGLVLSEMGKGDAAKDELYAEVLMALAIEDADDTDIALEVARDEPDGDILVRAGK